MVWVAPPLPSFLGVPTWGEGGQTGSPLEFKNVLIQTSNKTQNPACLCGVNSCAVVSGWVIWLFPTVRFQMCPQIACLWEQSCSMYVQWSFSLAGSDLMSPRRQLWLRNPWRYFVAWSSWWCCLIDPFPFCWVISDPSSNPKNTLCHHILFWAGFSSNLFLFLAIA